MRAFLGVPFPPTPALTALADELAGSGADLKMIAASNRHLTLKFLGEVKEAFVAPYVALLRGEGLPSAFEVALSDVGAFPSLKRFSTLWIGIHDATGGLAQWAAGAERAWVGLGGTPDDRPFRAHLTVARRRSDRGAEKAIAVMERHKGQAFGKVTVDHANLYRSTLTPQGPIYEVVERVAP